MPITYRSNTSQRFYLLRFNGVCVLAQLQLIELTAIVAVQARLQIPRTPHAPNPK
jgi:hypothetical protein